MNSRALLAIAAVAALAGAAARADDITIDTTPFQSTRTRADVLSELAQFRRAGPNPWAMTYDQLRGFSSSTTRAQVQAEYLAQRDQVAAMTGEDGGSAYFAQRVHPSYRTRLAARPFSGQ